MNVVKKNTIPRASLIDRLRFLLGHTIPVYLEGVFLRSRLWSRVFDLLTPKPVSKWLSDRMHRAYKTQIIDIGMRRSPLIVLTNIRLIDHVLIRSPFVYVDPPAKRRGMMHFQPAAVTIARGIDWRFKRQINDASLRQGDIATLLEAFLPTIESECERIIGESGRCLTWDGITTLFGRISRQLILGKAAREDLQITRMLQRLMRQANRLFFLRQGKLFRDFQRAVDGYVNRAESGSLLGEASAFAAGDRISGQVTHWMFAMNDTLAENSARALWLIPGLDGELKDRLADSQWCRHCLLETMRLFPTTQMLGRAMSIADNLNDVLLPAGTQVVVLNTAWHRDESNYPMPHRFQPQRWTESSTPQGYFLGGGQQRCAGEFLGLWVGGEILRVFSVRHKLIADCPVGLTDDLPWRLNPFRLKWQVGPSRK